MLVFGSKECGAQQLCPRLSFEDRELLRVDWLVVGPPFCGKRILQTVVGSGER